MIVTNDGNNSNDSCHFSPSSQDHFVLSVHNWVITVYVKGLFLGFIYLVQQTKKPFNSVGFLADLSLSVINQWELGAQFAFSFKSIEMLSAIVVV